MQEPRVFIIKELVHRRDKEGVQRKCFFPVGSIALRVHGESATLALAVCRRGDTWSYKIAIDKVRGRMSSGNVKMYKKNKVFQVSCYHLLNKHLTHILHTLLLDNPRMKWIAPAASGSNGAWKKFVLSAMAADEVSV